MALEVNNLSKRYRIGLKEDIHDTFIGQVTSRMKSPLSNFSRLRNLSEFSNDENAEDIIWSLKDISFELEYGKVLGIIGKNGAGKSTLLKILCRITEPTSGNAFINGRVGSLLEVGTGFHQELTGRENVFLNGVILGMTKKEIERKFDEIVDFSGVEQFIDTPVKRYSSGMRVRLAFAVAAHLEPEILLIDEVLAVGDVDFQNKCLSKMNSMSKSGRTILFVSHNMGAIQELCDRVILLDNGKLLMDNKTDEVINNYLLLNTNISGEQNFQEKNNKSDNKIVELKLLRVLDEEENICTNFTVRDDILLQMEYMTYIDLNFLSVSLYIYNQNGVLVFTTVNNFFLNKKIIKKAGYYRSTCKINRDLMNDGQYFIQCNFTGKKEVYQIEKNAIAITIIDNKDPEGSRGLYHENNWPPATVRPKLEWTNAFNNKSL